MGGARPSWLGELYALAPRGVVLGLDPVRAALAAFGDPQREIPCVHVAGTNGKGSVAAMVSAVLDAAGLRVGTFTSPHLHRYRERFRVGGDDAPAELVEGAAREVLEAMGQGLCPALTFFEATTVVAWCVFLRARVDVAVVEVGLGGRLDATNVCAPARCAITRVAFDHERLLGGTLAAIAREKAGILKPGVPCVLGDGLREGEARDAIEAVARAVGAPLIDAPVLEERGEDAQGRRRLRGAWAGTRVDFDVGLSGAHQASNAAVALALCERFDRGDARVDAGAITRGMAAVRWPGRLERVGELLFDVAHNPDGVAALVRAVPGAQVGALVFGASRDKDWRAMLDLLRAAFPGAESYFAAAPGSRAESAERLADYGGGVACATPVEALERARRARGAGRLVLVCGSVFLVGAVRAAALGIEEDPPLGQ